MYGGTGTIGVLQPVNTPISGKNIPAACKSEFANEAELDANTM
jgi:hypothetical protein